MEKNIFQYWNGEKPVFGDPLVIIREFKRACNWDDQALFKLSQSENEQQSDEASATILAAARVAMNMVPIDQETGLGATEEVVFAEFDRFQKWWAKKKQNIEPTPTLPQPLESSADQSPMNYSAAYGQISLGFGVNEPPNS